MDRGSRFVVSTACFLAAAFLAVGPRSGQTAELNVGYCDEYTWWDYTIHKFGGGACYSCGPSSAGCHSTALQGYCEGAGHRQATGC
jgi:hypothetical protein